VIVLLETVHPVAHRLLETADDVVVVENVPTLGEELQRDDVRALVTRGRGIVDADLLDRLPGLEVVARCGVGLDNIDTRAAARAGIAVVHAPGSTTPSVVEHALMLMLALARRLVELDGAVKSGNWGFRDGYEGIEMRGKRLGVVGLGAIGTRIAEIGTALGMDVVCTTRTDRGQPFPRLGLRELLETSDVVQLCAPLTDRTRGMIGADELAIIKPGALLVNTARGGLVDGTALSRALDAGRLGGYAADVWDPEPPGPVGSFTHRRTVITPHVAGLTDVTYREICVRPAEAVVSILTGSSPDPACVYGSSTVSR
jgi:D-3-phosphoglycerate dehydrogenase / 2-oxoglutarate reductase